MRAVQDATSASAQMGLFSRYLSLWVAIAIVVGILVGQFLPSVPQTLAQFEYAQVSLPIAVLIWGMIFPMMVQIDFSAIKNVRKHPMGLLITTSTNWLIKPFTMFLIAWLFFFVIFSAWIPTELAKQYLAGAILLGAAPCTAMVFVWSQLTRGDAAYTLVQVAVNDLIMLFAFAPIVLILLGLSSINVPWQTIGLSLLLYLIVPFLAGYATRVLVLKWRGDQWLNQQFLPALNRITPIALLLTLILLFAFQGHQVLAHPLHIAMIAVPLILQTLLIFWLAYRWAKYCRLPHRIAAPAALIGASNFFELAVATAIGLFGLHSGAALVTVVGVLVEVPIMLWLVNFANRTRDQFPST